jgi:16S rRNA (cytosine1402-N4)-methyltransferase
VSPIVEAFRRTAGGTFLDGTLGGGGHARAILGAFPEGKLWAMDADGEAIDRARTALPTERVSLIHQNFRRLDQLPQKHFDGILLDLGISSDQLDCPDRGFSFRSDGPLDMRMDRSVGRSAAEFLEIASHEELVRAVRDWGEEPHWKRVVDTIEGSRGSDKLRRTGAFADLMHRVLPANYRMKIDSATRVFQGIRIAVNGELEAIEEAIPKALTALSAAGVLAVITFHSLEDRIVKRHFREWSGMAVDRFDDRYADLRCAQGQLLTVKPIVASVEEVLRNPRSRSAKLRIFQKFSAEEEG